MTPEGVKLSNGPPLPPRRGRPSAETIRRLFTAEGQNPTAATLIKLARALGQRIELVPTKKPRAPRRSAA